MNVRFVSIGLATVCVDRRLWHDLALPALEASRQTRVEGELSALIMAALEDLAASPSAPHG